MEKGAARGSENAGEGMGDEEGHVDEVASGRREFGGVGDENAYVDS